MFEKVLIVDDEKVLAESISDYLGKKGISSRIEIDPTAAIESFKENPADVVIVDYKFASLSDKTGLDIIAEIRERKPSTRFLLISGWIPYDVHDPEVQNDLLARLKVDGYFRKPFKTRDLGDSVANLLATGTTNWVSVAKDYVGRGSVSASDVRKLNEGYKKAILDNIDNPDDL
jgi:two-component system OmpR family response regulator